MVVVVRRASESPDDNQCQGAHPLIHKCYTYKLQIVHWSFYCVHLISLVLIALCVTWLRIKDGLDT